MTVNPISMNIQTNTSLSLNFLFFWIWLESLWQSKPNTLPLYLKSEHSKAAKVLRAPEQPRGLRQWVVLLQLS